MLVPGAFSRLGLSQKRNGYDTEPSQWRLTVLRMRDLRPNLHEGLTCQSATRNTWRRWLCVASALSVAWANTKGFGAETSDPLLDLFIKKGYVTQAEAAKVKAEADAIRTN